MGGFRKGILNIPLVQRLQTKRDLNSKYRRLNKGGRLTCLYTSSGCERTFSDKALYYYTHLGKCTYKPEGAINQAVIEYKIERARMLRKAAHARIRAVKGKKGASGTK